MPTTRRSLAPSLSLIDGPQQLANKTTLLSSLHHQPARTHLSQMEQLADGRVAVREKEGGQLVVVRAGWALERHQLGQERLLRCEGWVCRCVRPDSNAFAFCTASLQTRHTHRVQTSTHTQPHKRMRKDAPSPAPSIPPCPKGAGCTCAT